MTAPATRSAVLALPDDVMVPVGWVRPLLENGNGSTRDPLGLTVPEVAERTGRALSTVRTWCSQGRLPGAKRLRGREWRIPPESLRALLDGCAPERLEVPRGGLSAWRSAG